MFNDNKQYLKLCHKYADFNFKPYLKDGITKQKILELKESFDLFDDEQKGFLELGKLKQNLNKLNIKSKNNEIDNLKNKGIETINFEQYFDLMYEKNLIKNINDVKKLYYLFLGENNTEKNLKVENFKKVAKDLELDYDNEELNELINCIGNSETGISFDEFYKAIIENNENNQ